MTTAKPTDDLPNIADLVRAGAYLEPPKQWPTFDGSTLDRNMFVTASEAHRCMRQLFFDKQAGKLSTGDVIASGEVSPYAHSDWGFFARGNNVEDWMVATLRRALDIFQPHGFEFRNMGGEQVSYHHEYQAGTPDVLLVRTDNVCFVGDFKSIDPRTNTTRLPKPENVTQIQQNIDLVRSCTDYDVRGGFLFYTNASNYETMIQRPVEVDEPRIIDLRSRARRVMTAADAGVLPPEGMWTQDGCKYCKHTDKCGEHLQQTTEADNLLKEAERALGNVFNGN